MSQNSCYCEELHYFTCNIEYFETKKLTHYSEITLFEYLLFEDPLYFITNRIASCCWTGLVQKAYIKIIQLFSTSEQGAAKQSKRNCIVLTIQFEWNNFFSLQTLLRIIIAFFKRDLCLLRWKNDIDIMQMKPVHYSNSQVQKWSPWKNLDNSQQLLLCFFEVKGLNANIT